MAPPWSPRIPSREAGARASQDPAAQHEANANVERDWVGQEPLGKMYPYGWRGAWPTEKQCSKGLLPPEACTASCCQTWSGQEGWPYMHLKINIL